MLTFWRCDGEWYCLPFENDFFRFRPVTVNNRPTDKLLFTRYMIFGYRPRTDVV